MSVLPVIRLSILPTASHIIRVVLSSPVQFMEMMTESSLKIILFSEFRKIQLNDLWNF